MTVDLDHLERVMACVNALYGFPTRAFSEPEILAAVQAVTGNFDEAPTRMAVLAWRSDDLVWLAFESASLGPGRVLARDHFAESLVVLERVPELVVVSRRFDDPNYFAHWVNGKPTVTLHAEGDEIVGRVPEGARTDGDVLEIGLRLAGLSPSHPFERAEEPDAMAWMRRDDEQQEDFCFVAPKARLPVGVEPPLEGLAGDLPRFARHPLEASGSDELRLAVASSWKWVTTRSPRPEARHIEERAHRLGLLGRAVAAPIVDQLAADGGGAKGFALGAGVLGRLGVPSTAPVLTSAFESGSKVSRAAAFHALATMGEAARTALEEGAAARRKKVRDPCAALLQLLDADAHILYREARAARDAMDEAQRQELLALLELRYPEIHPKERWARSADLLGKHGAAGLAVLLGGAIDDGRLLDAYEIRGYVKGIVDDPLAPFGVVVVCAEHWLPDHFYENVLDRTKLKAAASEVLGSKLRRASKTFALLPPYR